MRKHVVLGAGPLGVALGRILRGDGSDASVFSIMGNPAYDMVGTSPLTVDGAESSALAEVCKGADVIYLCLNAHYVDWYDLFPPRLEAAINAAGATGATLVYHDNVYMYGPSSSPLTEDTPYASQAKKGRLRGAMADSFLEAAQRGRLRGVIGRSADMYGPGALNSAFNSTFGQRHFYPLLAGKPVSIVGDIDQPHTYAYVDDVARGLATLGSRPEAVGGVWHIPAAPTVSQRQLMTMAFEVAGLEPKLRGSKISGFFVRIIGKFQRDVGEVAEILDQFEQPLVVSHGAFAEAFGADPTPHRTALKATLDWYRANPL